MVDKNPRDEPPSAALGTRQQPRSKRERCTRSASHCTGVSFGGMPAHVEPCTYFRSGSHSLSKSATPSAESSMERLPLSSSFSAQSNSWLCSELSPFITDDSCGDAGTSGFWEAVVGNISDDCCESESDFKFSSPSEGGPSYTIWPFSNSTSRSADGASRLSSWAFTATIRVAPRMACRTAASQALRSTSLSTDATGSSSTASLAPDSTEYTERARAVRARCPPDRRLPSLPTGVSSPCRWSVFRGLSMSAASWEASSALRRSASSHCDSGRPSRTFCLIVPSRSCGICGWKATGPAGS
mmetsp:Transcript_99045/g.288899  ORF Transcript_99045/g.288899 Transcript_99045/m.288899 type:complete len:299 (+) Transcript_99045:1960-2856(+)